MSKQPLTKDQKLFAWCLGIEILLILTIITVFPEYGPFLGVIGIIFTSFFILGSIIIMRDV